MGTRSRVILKRTTKSDIYLWMPWDGYWDGQGGNLCEQLRLLLETYTVEELVAMLEALDVPTLPTSIYQCFCGRQLGDFLTGKTTYMSDDCDDIEYEYVITMDKAMITGQHVGDPVYVLRFDDLKSFTRFEHIVPNDE